MSTQPFNPQLTANFHLSEFTCKDAAKTPVPEKYYKNVKRVAENLQVLRDHIGKSVVISGSGYRTKAHNTAVGGAKSSQHLTASAADISVKGMTPKELAKVIEHLISIGKMDEGGIGIYPTQGFVHYDIRNTHARW